MAEKIVRSVRADEATFGRLADLAKAEFGEGGQGAALEALLNLWDVQKAKSGIAGRQTEIEDFDTHLQAIQRGFLAALEIGQNAESRAHEDFRAELERKAEEINRLKERMELAEQKARSMEAQRNSATSDALKYEEAREAAETKAAAAADAATAQRQRADQLEKSLANEKEINQYLEAEIDVMREEYKKSVDAEENAKAETESLKKQIGELKAATTIAKAEAEKEKAIAVSAAEKENLENVIALMRENAELKIKLAEAAQANAKPAAKNGTSGERKRGRPPKKNAATESGDVEGDIL